jgi:transcriptional regulator with XRE-family HTH domain
MTTRTKQVAILLGAAVVLSSGAYALGSQAGGGGALARDAAESGSGAAATQQVSDRGTARGFDRHGRFGFGLDALASRLGVSPTALRDALQAIRTSRTPEQRRSELVQALATALGKPADQVKAAVDSVLPDRGARKDDFAAALAKELGVDTAKVRAAFDNLRQAFRDGRRRGADPRDAVVNAIASATGADPAKVRAALQKLRDTVRGERRRGDDIRARLATALKVTPDQLDVALDKVRTQQRDAFATELAHRLHIDVQKVKDALPDFRFGGRRHG